MKRGNLSIYRKKNINKKKFWQSLLGNLLLQNAIALVVYIILKCYGEKINPNQHFLISNCIALTVSLFNFFWED